MILTVEFDNYIKFSLDNRLVCEISTVKILA